MPSTIHCSSSSMDYETNNDEDTFTPHTKSLSIWGCSGPVKNGLCRCCCYCSCCCMMNYVLCSERNGMGYGPGSKVAVPDEQQQQQQRQNNIGRTWLTVYRGCRTSDEKTNQFCQHPLDSWGVLWWSTWILKTYPICSWPSSTLQSICCGPYISTVDYIIISYWTKTSV